MSRLPDLPEDIAAALEMERRAPEPGDATRAEVLDRVMASWPSSHEDAGVPREGSGCNTAGANGGDTVLKSVRQGESVAGSAGAAAGPMASQFVGFAFKPLPLALAMFSLGAAAGFGARPLLESKPSGSSEAVERPAPNGKKVSSQLSRSSPRELPVDSRSPATRGSREEPTRQVQSAKRQHRETSRAVARRNPRNVGQTTRGRSEISDDRRRGAYASSAAANERAAGALTGLGAERLLLERARAALARGDAGAALTAIADHRQAFPEGHLCEERDALAVQALADAGRREEARAEAVRFRSKYRESLFAPAVEAILGDPAGPR